MSKRQARGQRLGGWLEWFSVPNSHCVQAAEIALIAFRRSAVGRSKRTDVDQTLLEVDSITTRIFKDQGCMKVEQG